MTNIVFMITGFLFILLLLVIFLSKKYIHSVEYRYFKLLAIINLIGYILEFILQISVHFAGIHDIFSDFMSRLYLSYHFIWFGVFSIYAFVISLNKKDLEKYNKNLSIAKKIIVILIIFGWILAFILPQYIYFDGLKMYSYGPAVNAVKYGLFIYCVIWIVLLVKNLKNLTLKKYYPIFLVIIMLIVNGIVQMTDPSILIVTMVGTLACYTMYFTIENPYIKMLNELYKNKELLEQNCEDKYNFLFEMTQEVRNPVVNISRICQDLKKETLDQNVKDKVDNLYNLAQQLDFCINDILNISSLDAQKLKIINSKYELGKLCSDIEARIKPELQNNVEFNLNLPKHLPTLYGDYMCIRQILFSLLINACKNTTDGSINMYVSLIEKYDVCRVIYNISDTGKGMSLEQINDILSSTGSLDKSEIESLGKKEYNVKMCQKIVKIMGGNLIIKSNINKGTDVVLTIDQRVFHEQEDSILTSYENKIANYRKVLVVSQNKNILSVIKKQLNDNHITVSSFYYGADAIDRIKSGKKFSFVLLADEMSEMSGLMTLKGLKEIKDYNIPTIIMLDKSKEYIKNNYLDSGFNDYILLDNLENDLNRVIKNY